jgi:hypothetical protein
MPEGMERDELALRFLFRRKYPADARIEDSTSPWPLALG